MSKLTKYYFNYDVSYVIFDKIFNIEYFESICIMYVADKNITSLNIKYLEANIIVDRTMFTL